MEAAQKAREVAEAARAATTQEDPFAALLAEEEAAEAERKANEQAESAKASIRAMHTIDVPAAMVAPKVTGSASKTYTVWDYEITDPALVPLKYRLIDYPSIARDVRSEKGEFSKPGIRVFSRIEVR